MSDLEVRVRYQLGEYLGIVAEFAPRSAEMLAAREAARRSIWAKVLPTGGMFERLTLHVIGTPAFFYKKLRVGSCLFKVSVKQIERTSRSGSVIVPWAEVEFVHALSEAYLVELGRGAMPLPYRCFESGARSRFESLVPHGKLDGR